MLSTPPAFILSQDQTLVKSVCTQSRIAWQFCSCLLFWFDIFRCPFLKNLFKEFSGFVVYCSVINVLFCCCRFMRQLLYYIKAFHVCQQLFYFFFCCCEAVPHATALIEYHIPPSLSTAFLFVFAIRFSLQFCLNFPGSSAQKSCKSSKYLPV